MTSKPSRTSSGSQQPLKTVSEAVRQRETFKYEPFLFVDFRFNNSGQPFSSSEISTSTDSVLTALAQLGLHQTGTERSLISLFDSSYQYIVAEAVSSTPLAASAPSDDCAEGLSLCGTAIPRNHGVCEFVLYSAGGSDNEQCRGETKALPLTVIADLTSDARFASKPYCQFGDASRFFAAVPIRTRAGINIGVYCVMDEKAPDGWGDHCVSRMSDVSEAIMAHLEANRSTHAHRRNERMNRGVGSFVEGKSTISGWHSGPNMAAFVNSKKSEGTLDPIQQRLEREQERIKRDMERQAAGLVSQFDRVPAAWGNALAKPPRTASEDGVTRTLKHKDTDTNAGPPACARNSGSTLLSPLGQQLTSKTEDNNPNRIFSKAANIIREAFEIEGCVFVDVTLGSYRAPPVRGPIMETNTDGAPNQICDTSSSDEQTQSSSVQPGEYSCELLGFSTSQASSINGVEFPRSGSPIPKGFLAKPLKRYPRGKIFNFDAVGELQSMDSSEDGSSIISMDDVSSTHGSSRDGLTPAAARQRRLNDKQFGRPREGPLIHQAFLGARSVAFMPLWDSKRERWFAASFVYTLLPTRTFTVEEELSFLKAFAKLVTSEVLNLETLQADKAKSDALDSLSHELRSPLHGIILGTELLNDTDLNVFQENSMHTIETCCRTLLDTIDHLLDYSKVNSFAAKRKAESSEISPRPRKRGRLDQFGKKELYAIGRLDGLVEEVAESVFAGFNFQYMSIKQLSRLGKSMHSDNMIVKSRIDSAQAMEQLGPGLAGGGEQRPHFGNVSVYLSIDPTCNWVFNFQAGAIRRIVMNLFGNSLKYTTKGTIRVSLGQEVSTSRPKRERIVKLTVQDTGKGIGEDYLRHKLFKPFAQEDELSSGTGLGLSIVKMITNQIHGQISVKSQVGIGTLIVVTWPLNQPSQPFRATADLSDDDRLFEGRVRELKGLRVRLSGFETQETGNIGVEGRVIVEDMCRHWLQMDVISEEQTQLMTPDIVLWSDDALPVSFGQTGQFFKTPNVVVCRDALVAYERLTECETAGQGGSFDFISQPIGPRKFAKCILRAYKGWMTLAKLPSAGPPPTVNGSGDGGPPQPTKAPPRRELPSSDTTGDIGSQSQRTSADTDPAHPPGPESAEGAACASTSQPIPDVVSNKILLVDDNHINLKMLSAYMGKLGQPYVAVENGKLAVDAYTQHPAYFAAILMDISMPVMDGLEATRHIRAHEHRNQLPAVAILALTGLASESAQQEALESGVDIFLTKPVRFKTLSEVLQSMNILSLPQTL